MRNAIGNMQMVRGFERLARPVKSGLWQQFIPNYLPAPVKARKLLFFGQYSDAEAAYADLLKKEPKNQEYIEGHLDAILAKGTSDYSHFDKEVAALTDQQRSTPKLTRLRAQALVQTGKREEAIALLKKFDADTPTIDREDGETVSTVMLLGVLLERNAQYAAADEVYKRLLTLVEGKWPQDSLSATQLSLALYHSSTLAGVGHNSNRSVLYQLAQVRERDATYWPAILAEAEILIACHNTDEGGAALEEVLDLNPSEIQARFLAVDHAIDQYNFQAATQELAEIKLHTDSPEVSAYEGRLLLKERLPEQAIAPLVAALKRDPELARAHGWLAGAYYLTNEKDKMQQELLAIKVSDAPATPAGLSPEFAAAHPEALFEAGEILRDARQFIQAEKLYLQAKATAPWWSEPSAALAELYLEMGSEDKAKDAFDQAYKIDPYNLRAVNQMTLLGILQKFNTKESKTRLTPGSDQPAFIIRYSPEDEILADLVLEWMEKVRPELWSYFRINSLPAPTTLELFPSHEEFGVRTTGLPWIGTVGASTGNVIAMDVPRGGAKNMMGAFDWARVLRHEYTHTITLAMTNNRIPHWLTEAAACAQEEAPRDWNNTQMLVYNFQAGTLFKIADLNWGFITPKKSTDRQLAYMESQWIYEYLVSTYGLPKMLDFLQCFHDGLVEEKAWEKTYGKTMDQMDTEFLAFAKTQIESWGMPTDPIPKQEEIEAALKKDPKDVAALYNKAWLQAAGAPPAQGPPPAQKTLEQLLAIDPNNIKARELMGAVLNGAKQPDKARTILEAVVQEDPKRPVALRTLGLIAMAAKNYVDAEKWFLQLQSVRPLEETSYTNLAGIYLIRKDTDKAIGQLVELQRHEQRNELIPRKLAQLYLSQKDYSDAESSAYRSVRINPYNAINHEMMAQVLQEEKQPQKAVEYWQYAADLQPKVAEFWEGLADSKGASGDKTAAAAAARKALEIQPDSPSKKWLQ